MGDEERPAFGPCPSCGEDIYLRLERCPFCRAEIQPVGSVAEEVEESEAAEPVGAAERAEGASSEEMLREAQERLGEGEAEKPGPGHVEVGGELEAPGGYDESLFAPCRSCGQVIARDLVRCPFCAGYDESRFGPCPQCEQVIALGPERCPFCGPPVQPQTSVDAVVAPSVRFDVAPGRYEVSREGADWTLGHDGGVVVSITGGEARVAGRVWTSRSSALWEGDRAIARAEHIGHPVRRGRPAAEVWTVEGWFDVWFPRHFRRSWRINHAGGVVCEIVPDRPLPGVRYHRRGKYTVEVVESLPLPVLVLAVEVLARWESGPSYLADQNL